MVRMLSTGPQILVNSEPVERATFEITREMIEATIFPGRVPDHSWFKIDQSGHYHAFNAEGELPTLDAEYADISTLEDEEPDQVFIGWHCQICGTLIEPKYKPDPDNGFAKFAPGRLSWGGTFETWAQRFTEGESVSIRIPEMRRFGIAMIAEVTAPAISEGLQWSYRYVGSGELAERGK